MNTTGIDITEMLNSTGETWSGPQQKAMEALYARLKQIAKAQRFRIGPGAQATTALVNEAWLKVCNQDPNFSDRDHFFAYCALTMRHILISRARRQRLVTYVDNTRILDGGPVLQQCDFLLDLDAQLEKLKAYSPRLEAVFTYKFFGDMAFDSIAAVLGVSERSVFRDWKKARAMLAVAIGDE